VDCVVLCIVRVDCVVLCCVVFGVGAAGPEASQRRQLYAPIENPVGL
jgi:hypothetical protein